MPGPLHGYRVVDLTSMISGPLATMILADQGADVIKIENPDGGDHTRAANNRRNGFSASFLNNNRNKRSVALDLRDPAAKDALRRLVATADVFIQNFRPGVAERMGFGEDAVRAIKPDLIYVSISGFGETGPYAGKPVYDPLVQGMSGSGDDPGRLGQRTAPAGAHDRAGQIDRGHGVSGDHRGACSRASEPDRANMCGCRCWTR